MPVNAWNILNELNAFACHKFHDNGMNGFNKNPLFILIKLVIYKFIIPKNHYKNILYQYSHL